MLSDKYIAGFFDADGCISVNWTPSGPVMKIVFSQETPREQILLDIAEVFHGSIHRKSDRPITELHICGKHALGCAQRLKQHLVVKKLYMESMLEMFLDKTIRVLGAKEELKRLRLLPSPQPNFPSRKWLAGFTDGDGCFTGRIRKNGSFGPQYKVSASIHDRVSVDTIYKVFGGSITERGRIIQYTLYLSESKAEEFIEYFGNHLTLKKAQADYILQCARQGLYKNGVEMKAQLKHLKAEAKSVQQHRLSEVAVDLSTDAIVGLTDS